MTLALLYNKKYRECISICEEKTLGDPEDKTCFLNMLLCHFIEAVSVDKIKDFFIELSIETSHEEVAEYYEDELTFVKNCILLYRSKDIMAYCSYCLQYDTNVKTIDDFSLKILIIIKKNMMKKIKF